MLRKNKKTRLKERNGRIVNDDNKIAGPNGTLSRLMQNVLNENGISWMRLEAYINSYVRDTRNSIPKNRKDMTSAKGNIVKDATNSQMTWKVFVKLLRILQFTEVELSITVTHLSGKKTVHGTKIELGNEYEAVEFERRLEQPEKKELTYDSYTNLEWPYLLGDDAEDFVKPLETDRK